jgi:hypothetical protein
MADEIPLPAEDTFVGKEGGIPLPAEDTFVGKPSPRVPENAPMDLEPPGGPAAPMPTPSTVQSLGSPDLEPTRLPWSPEDVRSADSPDTQPDPLTTQATARMSGYDWTDIDAHLAGVREVAANYGYTDAAVDAHLGYQDSIANFNRLASAMQGNLTNPTEGVHPIAAASQGVLEPSTNPMMPIQVNALTPDVRQAYADALNNATTKTPQTFASDYTNAIQSLTGDDVSTAQDRIAAQLPHPRELVDYGIGLAQSRTNPRLPTFDTQNAPGMVSPGNLDPWNRPVLHNPDGSYSTTSSMSIGTDHGETLIPTVVEGKRLSDEDAIAHFHSTGENLGTFRTPAAADRYATALHNAQATMYDDNGNLKPPPPQLPMDPETAAIARRNMTTLWAQTNWAPIEIYTEAQQNPLLRDSLIQPRMDEGAFEKALGFSVMGGLAPGLTAVSEILPQTKKFTEGLAGALGTTAEQLFGGIAGALTPQQYMKSEARLLSGDMTGSEAAGFIAQHILGLPEGVAKSYGPIEAEGAAAGEPKTTPTPPEGQKPFVVKKGEVPEVVEPGPPMKFDLVPPKQNVVLDKLEGQPIAHDITADGQKVATATITQTGTTAHIQSIEPEFGAVKDMPVKLFGPGLVDQVREQYLAAHPEVDSVSAAGVSVPSIRDATQSMVDTLGTTRAEPRPSVATTFNNLMQDENGRMYTGAADVPTPKTIGDDVDRAMMKLSGNAKADRAMLYTWLNALPDEYKDPKFIEQVGHWHEEKMMGDNARTMNPVPPTATREFLDQVRPLIDEWDSRAATLRDQLKDSRMSDVAERQLPWDQGGLPRVLRDDQAHYNPADPVTEQNVITGGRGKLNAANFDPDAPWRKMYVYENDATGARNFGMQPMELKGINYGDKVSDPLGNYTVKPATMKEIETHTAGTAQPLEFSKHWLANMAEDVARMGRISRNLEVMKGLRDQLTEQGLFRPGNARGSSEGMSRVEAPQMHGYAAPRIAEAVNSFFQDPRVSTGTWDKLERTIGGFNRTIMAALFVSPVVHIGNVGAHYWTGRGWESLTPTGFGRQFKYMGRALKEVLAMGPRYQDFLRNGSGLLYSDTKIQNFHEMLLTKLMHEQMADQGGVWSQLSKSLGFTGAVHLVQWELQASRKILWAGGDMFSLARQMELEDRGLTKDEAVRKVEKDIPNYWVPSSVMGTVLASKVMKSSMVMNFGRYKYGQVASLYNMARDVIGVTRTPEERFASMGKVIALGALALGVYPLINYGLQQVFGPGSEMKAFGPLSIVKGAYGLTQGQKEWPAAVGTLLSKSPIWQIADQVTDNQNFWGKPIVNQKKDIPGMISDFVQGAGKDWYPTQLLEQSMKPGGVKQSLGDLGGLDLKTPMDPTLKAKFDAKDTAAAMASENKDAFAAYLRSLMGVAAPPSGTNRGTNRAPLEPRSRTPVYRAPNETRPRRSQ